MILPKADKWNRPDRYYDQALLAYIGLLLDPSRASVDVGANVGYVTRFVAARSRATVFAIEPGSANLACLRENVADLPNVEVVPRAAAEFSGRVVQFINGGTVTDHVAVTDRSKKTEAVETVAVDDVVRYASVGLIKIDVEGYEVNVLTGAYGILCRDRPTCVVEVVDDWLRRFGHGRRDVLRFFRDLGYQPPVDRFGRVRDDATDLIFAPDSISLPKLYLAYESNQRRNRLF